MNTRDERSQNGRMTPDMSEGRFQFNAEPVIEDSAVNRRVGAILDRDAAQTPISDGLSNRVFRASVPLLKVRAGSTLAQPLILSNHRPRHSRLPALSRLAMAACMGLVFITGLRLINHNQSSILDGIDLSLVLEAQLDYEAIDSDSFFDLGDSVYDELQNELELIELSILSSTR